MTLYQPRMRPDQSNLASGAAFVRDATDFPVRKDQFERQPMSVSAVSELSFPPDAWRKPTRTSRLANARGCSRRQGTMQWTLISVAQMNPHAVRCFCRTVGRGVSDLSLALLVPPCLISNSHCRGTCTSVW